MKKIKFIIPAVLMTLSVACVAAGCGTADHTHTYSNSWSHDEVCHWHEATCEHDDKSSDKEAHNFVVTVVEPTHFEAGYTHHECVCGYSYDSDEVATIPGNHTPIHHAGQEATCYTEGWEPYDTCSACEYSSFKAVEKVDHEYGNSTVCVHCEAVDPNVDLYVYETGTNTCTVKGIGTAEGSVIRIPEKHNGKRVTAIANDAFAGTSITKVILPESVTTIGIRAFMNCDELKEVYIPANSELTTIKESAFESCSALTTITLPANLTSLGYQAFIRCTSLEEITIPGKLSMLDYNTFMYCTKLATVNFTGSKLTTIKWNTFYGCTALKSITLPSSIALIGQNAFGASGLTSIVLPESLEYVATGAFKGCTGLTSVTFENTNGWSVGSSGSVSATSVSESDLANAETAATLLTSTYANTFWQR